MPKRRTITAAMAKRIILCQLEKHVIIGGSLFDGGFLMCPLCRNPIGAADDVIYEHMQPLALGGADHEANIRLVHKSCARKKTIGAPATTAGSDVHDIAKAKRLAGGNKPKRKKKIAQSSDPWNNSRYKLRRKIMQRTW